ncbi:MAG TPA: hypothetical protein VNX28_03530 [Gemmataceae bacterium]|nr:hypothetical protein [Gemmataceae bacterium]
MEPLKKTNLAEELALKSTAGRDVGGGTSLVPLSKPREVREEFNATLFPDGEEKILARTFYYWLAIGPNSV